MTSYRRPDVGVREAVIEQAGLLTTRQAANRIGVTAQTLIRWTEGGRATPALPSPYRGASWGWDVEEINRLIALRSSGSVTWMRNAPRCQPASWLTMLGLMAQDRTRKQIAREMGISLAAVHQGIIVGRDALGCSTVAGTVVEAIRQGYITVDRAKPHAA